MKKTPIIKIQTMKNIWVQDKFTDTDRDRVPNYRDCQTLNPLRQDPDEYDIVVYDDDGKVLSDKQQNQYLMKRDTLALQMYDKHFVYLTPDQKRNVTREFNKGKGRDYKFDRKKEKREKERGKRDDRWFDERV